MAREARLAIMDTHARIDQQILRRVVHDPQVFGGEACLRGTRVPVWVVVATHRLEGNPATVMAALPSLTTEDVQAALAYYGSHREEIDRAIREHGTDDAA